MASNGSFNTNAYAERYLTFAWTEKSQDPAKNQTVISWTLKGAGGPSTWFKSGPFEVVIAGVTVYSSSNRIELAAGTLVASGTHTIVHNTDGTKSFTASVKAAVYLTATNLTGSATFTLDTIPRASQPSLVTWPETTNDVGEFGQEFSIHMNRQSSAFTHTVRYEYGSRSGTIATGVTTGTTWTIPLSFMNDIPAATRASGRIYVDTYNGNAKVGTRYTGFTVNVPASVAPTCAMTWEDVTGVKDIYGSPVQGLSKLKITVNPTLAYGSPIDSYTIKVNGATYTTKEATTNVLKSDSFSVVVSVKDKRGRTGARSYSMAALPYSRPSISKLTVHRSDADGTENDQGEYIRVLFSATVTALNNKNTAEYAIRYKKTTDTTYTEVPDVDLLTDYTVSNRAYVFPADVNTSYDVEVEAKDRHNTSTRATSASTAFVLMSWGADGTSIGVLKVAERPGAVDVGGDVYLNGHALYGAHGMHDTRDTNESPEWYISQYGRGTVWEFKALKSVGFTAPAATYGPMQTIIPWNNASGGLPRQVIYEGRARWTRIASSATVWGAWQSDALIAYPVGSVYIAYNHTDPGTLFGGTWVRIQNAFLWAADSSGVIGQTGGEKDVTLTTEQIPAHTHGSVYSQHATGTKDKAWYSAAGSSVAYGTVSAGGGKSHNNMPPYIQVSIWRRTA